MYKNYRTCKAKNKLQVDFSKSHLYINRVMVEEYNTYIFFKFKTLLRLKAPNASKSKKLPNLIYFNRVMIEEYSTYFKKN